MRVGVDLPFSRKLELEADAIGLQLMARACYDPRASVEMNTALGALETRGAAQLKYFSTHPPSAERVQALRCVRLESDDLLRHGLCPCAMREQ